MAANNTHLKKELGLRDLVLFNIACVVGLSSLTQSAQFGWSSFILMIIAMACFLIPLGLLVIDLNGRLKGEGGFYLWTKSAFGPAHGFIAAWTYWLSNVVWFPAVMITLISSGLYIFEDHYLSLKESASFTIPVSLGMLWMIIILNIFGLRIGKWIQNIGAISVWILLGLLFVVSLVFLNKYGFQQAPAFEDFIPDLSNWSIIPFFAAIAYSFGGLELSSVMSTEIKNPKKNITRSIFLSGLIIALLYIIGTFSLLVSVPQGQLNIEDGFAQSFLLLDQQLNWPFIGVLGALLVTFGTIGLFAAWLNGSARLPYAIGLDKYLPEFLGKVHPKYRSPYMSLIVQGVVVSILIVFSLVGSGIKEAYSTIYDLSVILYFIPFLYMFAAFLYHNRKQTGGDSEVKWFRGSMRWVWICACLGFAVIFISIILAFLPSSAIENKAMFYLKILGVTSVFTGIGLLIYYLKR